MKLPIPNELSIKLLIFVFFLVGLENIQLPPLEKHEWRQTLTLSIAQNFVEHPNFFYPRMDIGGATEGIISCEFPIFNYILAILFKFLGNHHWFGRLLNWTVSCIGLWFFYDLIRKMTNQRTAFYALAAIMGSIVFEYARKSMPDTFALFVTMSGVWFLRSYLEKENLKYLITGFLLTAIGILSKIPFLLLLTFLIPPFLSEAYSFKAKRNVAIAVFVAMIAVSAWYFYWMPFLLEHYKNQLIWPVSLTEGWFIVTEKLLNESWQMLLDKPFHFKTPFLVAVMGLGLIWAGPAKHLKLLCLSYLIIFFLFTLKTGIVFPTHEYYVIPLLPLLALSIGYFFDQLNYKNILALGLFVLVFWSGFYENKLLSFNPSANSRNYMLGLSQIMDRYSQPNDKIMVNCSSYNAFMMYWAKRTGWTVNNDVPGKTEWMADFKSQGLKYIVIDRHFLGETLPYPLLYEDKDFRIYQP